MRNRLKYGVPALVGLGAAGAAAAQDGNPLEVLGAGGAAALGGAAGLLGARALAGKYSPELVQKVQRALGSAEDRLSQASANRPDGSMRADALLDLSNLAGRAADAITERGVAKVAAAGLVPAAGVAAGLGGMAAGQLVGGVGQLMGIDPEAPGSSNTMGSRMSMQSPMLPMY
jgi:hypothetical protein